MYWVHAFSILILGFVYCLAPARQWQLKKNDAASAGRLEKYYGVSGVARNQTDVEPILLALLGRRRR
jgi:hypothetical protein